MLLVDDEPDYVVLMKKTLGSWGYEVVTAQSASEALEVLKKENPDILVLDYLMPVVNGVELLKKIRTMGYSRIPAVLLSAHLTIKAIEEGRKLNIAAVIPKMSPSTDTQADLKAILDTLSKE